MKYTGEQLYGMYKRAHAQLGCATDEWEDLEQWDRDAWDQLALALMED